MNKSLLNTALKSLIPNTETYEERCYVFKQTKNMEPKRKNHWKIACFESTAYSFSYFPSFVYNTKFEYINIPPLVLCHLEVINVRDFACQESYRHIYTLMAPSKTKIGRLSQTFTVYICEIESFASRVVRLEGICNQYWEKSQERWKRDSRHSVVWSINNCSSNGLLLTPFSIVTSPLSLKSIQFD